MKPSFLYPSINGIGIRVKIYGTCYFIVDCYGFGVNNGHNTNRICFYTTGGFASDYKLNMTQKKFVVNMDKSKDYEILARKWGEL